MYHSETQTAMYDHSHVESSLPAWPRGPQALLFGPGWLVLKLMDAILQCPGSEASWRDEVRRQCGSSRLSEEMTTVGRIHTVTARTHPLESVLIDPGRSQYLDEVLKRV